MALATEVERTIGAFHAAQPDEHALLMVKARI